MSNCHIKQDVAEQAARMVQVHKHVRISIAPLSHWPLAQLEKRSLTYWESNFDSSIPGWEETISSRIEHEQSIVEATIERSNTTFWFSLLTFDLMMKYNI